jgi:ligand-binding sensor domain-containing protein/serine phosphatase RsbU (regulator of sigma subunit)
MNDQNRVLRLVLLISIFICGIAHSQSPYFKTISVLKSHQPVSVSSIFQDSKGYIWISSSQGLIRYDGIDSYIFDRSDSIDISPVTAIAEDSLRQVWIGHKNGSIEFLSDNHFRKFMPEEGLGHSEISFMKFDSKGVFWFGTLGEGLYYYSGKNRRRVYNINKDDGLNDNNVYTMAISADGRIFLGTDLGINIFNSAVYKISTSITMKNGLPDNIVKHLEVSGNTLWIGMYDGICTYSLDKGRFSLFPEWSFGIENTFTLKSADECWVSTKTNGIIRLKLENSVLKFVKKYSAINGLPENSTQTIFTDRETNIWIAGNKELIIGASSEFEFIDKKSEDFDFGAVFSFIVDSKGRYWAATQQGLICVSHDNQDRLIKTPVLNQIKEIQQAFISLYEDSLGFIWAGTYGYGVYRIDPDNGKYIKYDIMNGLPDNNVLYITGKGRLVWLATAGGGAAVYDIDKKSFKTYNLSNGLGSNYLYSIFIDSNNNTWFALDGKGTSVLMAGKLNPHFLPDSLGINTIYAVTEDTKGGIWFLTSEKGLLLLKAGVFKFYNETNGLKSNNVRSMISDKAGNIVFASNEGIQVYICAAGGFETFGEELGLAYLEPNLNGISCAANGTVWISESNGVVKYIPVNASQHNIEPKITITRKLLFFNPIDSHKNSFHYNQNHITFEYSGIWIQASEKLLYRYKIDNYDFDWSIPSHSRSITYSNLPPGRYKFKVEVSCEPGQWIGGEDASFIFRIRPPFYKTWWFIIISLGLFMVIVFAYIKSRTAHLRKLKDELELEVQKRTKTILNQKDEIATQRDEIEAQRDFVTRQRDKISIQHENITASIQCASRIQKAILPPEEDIELRLRDYFIYNRPMDIVSGDFYWISSKNNRIFIVAADCTGHGVSGAFMSVLGISLLNKIIFTNPNLTASAILDQLREEVKYALRQTGKQGEPQDGMDLSLIILENEKQIYQFAAANNPAYLVRNGAITMLHSDRMPIGIYPKEVPFTNLTGQLFKNDLIYLCSDGFKDQFGGPFNKKFQAKQFHQLLLKIAPLPMNEQINKLNSALMEWKSDEHLNDDILVMGFRIN